MSIQIGRFGFGKCSVRNDADSPQLLQREPSVVVLNGDQISIEGFGSGVGIGGANQPLDIYSEYKSIHARSQLEGLVENHEAAVPILSDEAVGINGLYRVDSAETATTPVTAGSYLAGYEGTFAYRVRATRVSGPVPLVESRMFGAIRPNDHGLTTCRAWWGLPRGAWRSVNHDNPTIDKLTVHDVHAETTDQSGSGEMDCYYEPTVAGQTDIAVRYVLPLSAWYEGACEIRTGWDLAGVKYMPITGTRAPLFGGDWEIGNGLVRIRSTSTEGSGKVFDFEVYDNAAGGPWDTIATIKFGSVGVGYTSDAGTVSDVIIIKNTPAECVLRLVVSCGDGGVGSSMNRTANLDLRVRRGSRHIGVTVTALHDERWQLAPNTSIAASSPSATFFNQMYASGNDANGHRLAIFCADTNTVNTTTGNISLDTAAYGADFALCAERGGTGATGSDDWLIQLISWMWATSETVRVLRA